MIDHIAELVRTICRNRAEIYPLKNILYAKLVTFGGLKNVSFDSELNVAGALPLSHYCLNFIPSGGNKNNSINIIDKYLFDFVKKEIDNINLNVRNEYIDTEMAKVSKNKESVLEQVKADAINQEQLENYITDATPEAIYDNIELIKKLHRGFIFNKNTEYAQYYEKSVYDKTSNNTQFLNIFYDGADGVFASRKIRGKSRPEVEGITVGAIWMSDFNRMSDPLINKNFKNRLFDGYVRRIYPYYNPRINYALNPPEKPTAEEIKNAKDSLADYREWLFKIYRTIKTDTCYRVSEDTTELLRSWYEEVCEPRVQALYKGRTRTLDLNNGILERALMNSEWTILKLLVIMHMLHKPAETQVDDTYLDDAIKFWEEGYKSWQNIIFNKNYTDIDRLVDFFLSRENVDLTKTDIRKECEFDKNFFKFMFENSLSEVIYMLNELGYNLEEYKGRGNTIIYRCRKISSIIPHLMNVSVAKLKTMSDTPTKFEFQELEVKDFIKLIKEKSAFVPCELKNGERKSENNIGNQNTIWLDFDDIKSMEAIKTMFEDYSYIAYTSKNHQQEKHGIVSDRFRLILFTSCLMPDNPEQYKRVMKNLITAYNTDKACSDLARLYWSNPQAEVFVNKGKLFDWRPYDVDYQEAYKMAKTNIIKRGNGRSISDVLFTEEGDRRLKVGQVVPTSRNNELFRIAIFLCHLIKDGELNRQDAVEKMKDIINRMDKTDFGQNEIDRMISIVERWNVEE